MLSSARNRRSHSHPSGLTSGLHWPTFTAASATEFARSKLINRRSNVPRINQLTWGTWETLCLSWGGSRKLKAAIVDPLLSIPALISLSKAFLLFFDGKVG